METMEPFTTIEAPSGISGSAFCTVKSVPLTLTPNRLVEAGLSDLAERREFAKAGGGEEDVDAALLLLHRRVQSIQIYEIGNVPLDAGDGLADLVHRGVEIGSTATRDENK